MSFIWVLHVFHVGCYKSLMCVLHEFHVGFTWVLCGLYMSFMWVLHEFHVVSGMSFMWFLHEFHLGFTWVSCGFCMSFMWVLHEFHMGFTWVSCGFLHEFQVGFTWDFMWVDFTWASCRFSCIGFTYVRVFTGTTVVIVVIPLPFARGARVGDRSSILNHEFRSWVSRLTWAFIVGFTWVLNVGFRAAEFQVATGFCKWLMVAGSCCV